MEIRAAVNRCVGDVVGCSFFSGAVALSNVVDDFTKTCHVRGLPVGSIRGLARKAYVSCVSNFPCRVYIDSNCHDSDMSNCISCDSHHIDNLMKLMMIYVGIKNFALL
jgi:hypothetical protein